MGAFAPSPLVDAALDARIMREIIEPVMRGMRAEGHEYRGFLYVGLMITRDGPKVIEFNVRFGDPEAQVVMPSIAGSLAPALVAAADGALPGRPLALTADKHVGVVLASGDYPRAGSERPADRRPGRRGGARPGPRVPCRHRQRCGRAGRDRRRPRRSPWSAAVRSYEDAIGRAYDGAARISFDGMQYRRDIGRKALTTLNS